MFWNDFVSAFLHGRTTSDDELRALADIARMCLAVLQERGLLMRSPQLLGYLGQAWLRGRDDSSRPLSALARGLTVAWDETAQGSRGARMPPFAQVSLDLAFDALQFAVLDRAVSLHAVMEPGRTIRPLIVANVCRFIYDRQRGADPSGHRLYQNVVQALGQCQADGTLTPVATSDRATRPLSLTWTTAHTPGASLVSLDEALLRERIQSDAEWFDIAESLRTERAGVPRTLGALVLRVVGRGEGVRGRVLLRALDALSRPLDHARRDPDAAEVVRVVDDDGAVELVPIAPPAAEAELSVERVAQGLTRMLASARNSHHERVLRAVLAHVRETRALPSVDKLLGRMREDGTLDCARTRLSVTLREILDDLRRDLVDLS